MRPRFALVLLLIALCACKPPEDSHDQAIVGAVLIDGLGGPPLTNSIVLISQGRVAEAGRHGEIPVSGEIAKVDGSGRYVVPGLIDVYSGPDPRHSIFAPGASGAEGARALIAHLAEQKPAMLHLWPKDMKPDIVADLVQAARDAHIPLAGHPATQAEAKLLVQDGATVLIDMIHDTDSLDPAFVTNLRDLRILYAPALAAIRTPADLDRARKNTSRLFVAGVPLAAASSGGDLISECEQMAQAGVPPLDVIVAATQNGARALGQSADRGVIQAGKRADLLLLGANPGEDIRNLRRVDRRMTNGEWR